MIQPFKKIEGYTDMKYEANFISDSHVTNIQDRDRYFTTVVINPWGKLKEFKCECKGFTFRNGKALCKHISNNDLLNPGLLQILKQWNEIDEIPTIEE